MGPCEAINCGYFWQEEWEDFPTCHYPYDDGYAPCELEEQLLAIDDDCGFDPYEGCYTYDC